MYGCMFRLKKIKIQWTTIFFLILEGYLLTKSICKDNKDDKFYSTDFPTTRPNVIKSNLHESVAMLRSFVRINYSNVNANN